MNKYEGVIIVKSKVDCAEIIKKVTDLINSNGKMEKVEELGVRRLAYRIQGYNEGKYVAFYFETEPKTLVELERMYRITDDIIKFINIRIEGE